MGEFFWPILEVIAKSVPASKMPVATRGFGSSVADSAVRFFARAEEQIPSSQDRVKVLPATIEYVRVSVYGLSVYVLSVVIEYVRVSVYGLSVVVEGVCVSTYELSVVVDGDVVFGVVDPVHPVVASQLVVVLSYLMILEGSDGSSTRYGQYSTAGSQIFSKSVVSGS